MRKTFQSHKKLYYYILFGLISFGPLAVLGTMLEIKLQLAEKWLLLISMQGISSLIYFYPISIAFMTTFALMAIVFIQELNPDLLYQLSEVVSAFISNSQRYLAGFDVLDPINSLIAWIVLSIPILIIILILLYRWRLPQLVITVALGYMAYAWYNYIDSAYYYIILLLLGYGLFQAALHFRKDHNSASIQTVRNQDIQFLVWQRFSIRYTIVIILIAFLLPKGDAVIEWWWLENQLTTAFPAITEFRKDTENTRSFTAAELFDFTDTGFLDDDGILGGPVTLNDTVIFTVDAPYPLYLRGNILTTYDGRSWQHGKRLKIEADTGTSLRPEQRTGEKIQLTITNKNFSSFTLFTPYQPLSIDIERDGVLWLDTNHQLTLLGARYKNESYVVTAFIPSHTQTNNSPPASILFNKEAYLELPESLPERIYKLTAEIVANTTTQEEQVTALVNYLRTNYSYTLDGAALPVGEDFVDYFLFESNEGYCTYFATSLAVMLRTLDIPTRYVEGFRMPDANTGGTYDIAFSNGHAWIEAYLDDSGWTTFEPTPAFTAPLSPREYALETIPDERDLYSLEDEVALLRGLKGMSDLSTDLVDEDATSSAPLLTYSRIKYWLTRHLLTLVLLLTVLVLPARIIYMRYRVDKYKLKLSKDKDQLLFIYQNILELFEHIGHKRAVGETPLEFAKRSKRYLYDEAHDFELVTKRFVDYKYSLSSPDDITTQSLQEFFEFSEHRLRYKLGFWEFYKLKYVYGTLYKRYV